MGTIRRSRFRSIPMLLPANLRSPRDRVHSHRLHLYFSRLRSRVSRLERESDRKSCAFVPLACHLDLAFMSFHDAVQHGQPEAYSLSFRFRGEERVEDLGKVFWG